MIASAGPSALWYLTRGAGGVALLLLTASVVLGIVHADRRRPAGVPRLLVDSAHRTVSLLVLAILSLHVATSVLDGYAPIRLLDAVVPLASSYRPLWVGFGALALDLLIALTVTSLVRARLGYRAWRALHWLAYACWPVAILHGLGTGSDAKTAWLLALTLGCVTAVLIAVGARLASTGPGHRAVRGGAAGALITVVAGLAVWLPGGPLARGWARRAGTPATLLASFAPRAPAVAPRAADRPTDPQARAFSSRVSGTLRQGRTAAGVAVLDLSLRVSPPWDVLRVRLAGSPIEGGGVSMTSSAVTLGGRSEYRGRIGRLVGTTMEALVGDRDARALLLRVRLHVSGAAVGGRVTARPVKRSTH